MDRGLSSGLALISSSSSDTLIWVGGSFVVELSLSLEPKYFDSSSDPHSNCATADINLSLGGSKKWSPKNEQHFCVSCGVENHEVREDIVTLDFDWDVVDYAFGHLMVESAS